MGAKDDFLSESFFLRCRFGWSRQQTTTYSSFLKTNSQGLFSIHTFLQSHGKHLSWNLTICHTFGENSVLTDLTKSNQSDILRDSTDFETQLYLCNEAFKVWTLTPFNSSKTSQHILANLAQTLKNGLKCKNISLENTFAVTNPNKQCVSLIPEKN